MIFFTATYVLSTLLLPAVFVSATFETIAYRVSIKPFSNISTTPAKGFATIFAEASKNVIGYAGIVSNLESNLLASTCNATNGCGVHIHTGRSCLNTTTQGGHYYINTTFPIDPWIDERYSSDATGKANFQSIVRIGTIDIEGRVFIVHSKSGSRIGCGIIRPIPVGQNELLKTTTTNLTTSSVSTKVLIHTVKPDIACYFGSAKKLESNLVSFLNNDETLMGKDCNFTNGCGVHIHSGTSCFNRTTQGGHYYNETTHPLDPWLYTMYHATDSNGNAYFTGCVETGIADFTNRPFVIHSNNGTRVSCGLLQGDAKDSFTLIDPITDLLVGTFGSVIDYSVLGTESNLLNIVADFVAPYKSARITFDKPSRSVCETSVPFSVFGEAEGNFSGISIPLGSHVVTALPYNGQNCAGKPGKTLSKTFDVVGCTIRYSVKNVTTKTELFPILKGSSAPSPRTFINIDAEIGCGFRIEEVRFNLLDLAANKVLLRHIEVEAPYYIFGNRGSNIKPGRNLSPGSYSISTSINDIDHGTINFTLT